MALKDEILNFTDADGLVAPFPTQPGQRSASGNGILYTSLYAILLKNRGELTPSDTARFESIFRSCQVYPGLFKRGPVQNDQEAFDDYNGLLAASKALKLSIAPEILSYGLSQKPPGFVYNNVSPGKWDLHAWLGRNPAFVAHLYFSAGKPCAPLINFAAWLYCVASGGKLGDQDSWIMSWLMVQAMPDNFLCRMAARRFKRKLQKAYPEGMKPLLAMALGGNPNHPLVKYFVDQS